MGVLLVPSSSPTLSPIYDGLDVNVTSNVTWFHLNDDIVSRRIYKLSFYGGRSIKYWCIQGSTQERETKPRSVKSQNEKQSERCDSCANRENKWRFLYKPFFLFFSDPFCLAPLEKKGVGTIQSITF